MLDDNVPAVMRPPILATVLTLSVVAVTCMQYSAECNAADVSCDARAAALYPGPFNEVETVLVEAVVAVTGGGAVYRSLDGGLSYEQIGVSEHAGSQLFAALISPTGEVMVGGLRAGSTYVSLSPDLGRTWRNVTGLEAATGQVQGIAHNPNSGRWVITGNAGLLAWYSDDGLQWISAPVAGAVGNLGKVVFSDNAFHLTASSGAQQGMYRSVDGSSFNYSGPMFSSFRAIEGNGVGGLASVGAAGSGAFSADGGVSWTASAMPPAALCTDLLFDEGTYLASCNDGTIQQSPTGNAWVVLTSLFVASPTLEWTGSGYLLSEVNAGVSSLYSTANPAAPGAARLSFAGFLQHFDYQLARVATDIP